jgi:hypothetical protein
VTKSNCSRSAYLLIWDESILVKDGIVLRSLRDNATFSGNIKYPGPEDMPRQDVKIVVVVRGMRACVLRVMASLEMSILG